MTRKKTGFLLFYYLLFTVVLFVIGPWDWSSESYTLSIMYLILVSLYFLLGYLSAYKVRIGPKRKIRINNKIKTINLKFLYLVLFVSLVMFIIDQNIPLSDYGSFVNKIVTAIGSPQTGYIDNLFSESSPLILQLINILFYPVKYFAFVYIFHDWKLLEDKEKRIGILIIVIEITSWLLIGTNKGIVDLFIIFIGASFFQKAEKKRNIKGSINVVFTFIIVLITVAYFLQSRYGTYNYYASTIDSYASRDTGLMLFLPNILQPAFSILTNYLGQGYYAFSRTFSLKRLEGMLLPTSSWTFLRISNFVSGQNLNEQTYVFRLQEFGIHPYSNWHSLYTWLLNDFGYVGIGFLMFALGYFTSRIRKRIDCNRGIYSLPLFCLLVQILIYIPANNQVFNFPSTFFTFVIMVIGLIKELNDERKQNTNYIP